MLLLLPAWSASGLGCLKRVGRLRHSGEEEPPMSLSTPSSGQLWPFGSTTPQPEELEGDAVEPEDAPTQGTSFSCSHVI
jgi:hypothetical protein